MRAGAALPGGFTVECARTRFLARRHAALVGLVFVACGRFSRCFPQRTAARKPCFLSPVPPPAAQLTRFLEFRATEGVVKLVGSRSRGFHPLPYRFWAVFGHLGDHYMRFRSGFSVLEQCFRCQTIVFSGAIIALPRAVERDRRGARPSGGSPWLCGLLAACCEACRARGPPFWGPSLALQSPCRVL